VPQKPVAVGQTPNTKLKVMVSYNWGIRQEDGSYDNQERVKLVVAALKASGVNVWFDLEQMSGSIAERMAEAVEESDYIIICASKLYKESINCRLECEYAQALKKPIIPMMCEKQYRPNGWLGLVMGVKLYYDITNIATLHAQTAQLVAAELKLQTPAITATPAPPPPAVAKASVDEFKFTGLDVNAVADFLARRGVGKEHSPFAGLTGAGLQGLRAVRTELSTSAFTTWAVQTAQLPLCTALHLSHTLLTRDSSDQF